MVLFLVVFYEVLVIGGIGLYLARKSKEGEDEFLLSGRQLPASIVGVTLALTVLGSAHVFGLMELAWNIGAVSLWFSFAHVILLCVVCLGTGRWVRRLNVSTVPELIENLYGIKVRTIVACVMGPIIFGLLTMETQTIGIAFSAMTGWSIQKGALVGGIIGIFYVILAGMKEIGWVNIINTIVMYLGMVVACIYLAFSLPGQGWDSVSNFYINEGQAWMIKIMGTPDLLFNFAFGTILAVVFAQGISQMALQTAMSAKDENTVKKALWIAAPINGAFGIFSVSIGLAAKTIPQFHKLGPKMAGPTLLVKLLPEWLVAWLLASFLGALLSTFAMTCMTPSTLFVKDIFVNLYKKDASEAEETKMARLSIIVLAVIAIAVASALPPIVEGINWLFAWLVPVFWVVIYGLFWKRSTTATVSILSVCWIVNLLWSFTSLPEAINLAQIQNAHVTFAISIVLGIILNSVLKGKPAYFKAIKQQDDLTAESV